ncbi:MAG: hypothetical protein HS126_09700 [Anaerolineales bacterium]|nr:hypothetical protein [Anaerolineales bacterium]
MATKTRKKTISLKVPGITLQQLEDLSEEWKENSQSQIIIRCIEKAWRDFIGTQAKKSDKQVG